MTEKDARAALRAQGITNPSKALVENWLRVQQYEEAASLPQAARETVRDMQPCINPSLSLEDTSSVARPSSESNLEPFLRERGELVREHPRRVGRPKVIAPWFQAVATRMADGTPLRKALASLGIHLGQREIRALYRNTALSAMRREARQKWQREWGLRSRRRRTARPKGCRGGDCLGSLSAELRRIL